MDTKTKDVRIIALVSLAHACSHFFHLIVAPLFPWLKDEFNVSWTELGFLMTVFFAVSGFGQAAAGFVVDKFGARRVLFAGLALLGLGAMVIATAPAYAMLIVGVALCGAGNAVFHPVDFSILNAQISTARLGHAFSMHGLSGTLGWAAAPIALGVLAAAFGWRTAVWVVACLPFIIIGLLIVFGQDVRTDSARQREHRLQTKQAEQTELTPSMFAFLAVPSLWTCFLFFFLATTAFSAVQSFGATLLKILYDATPLVASGTITAYLVCQAIGMVLGGMLVARVPQHERQIAGSYGLAALGALAVGVLLLSGVQAIGFTIAIMLFMGFANGLAGPSRDMLIRKAAPSGALGRVYGVVYSGADVGFSVGPLLFGWMIDHGLGAKVFFAMALFQALAVVFAVSVGAAIKKAKS